MKIKASKPFTHAGQTVNTGDVIDVPARSSRGIAGAATKD